MHSCHNPPQFAVNNLPTEELRKIVDAMEAQAGRLDSQLKRNRAAWFGELDRLRRKCQKLEGSKAIPSSELPKAPLSA